MRESVGQEIEMRCIELLRWSVGLEADGELCRAIGRAITGSVNTAIYQAVSSALDEELES